MAGKTSSSPHHPVPRNTRLRQARKRLSLSQENVAKQIGVATLTYSRWEKGETFPTPYNRRSLCTFFGMSAEELGFVIEQERAAHTEDTSRIWNVPFEPNPFFTGREEILEILHKTLHAGKTTALTQKQAISGLGGVGKTQTAVEYAYHYANEYEIVLWIKADSRDSITSDFVGIAHMLNLPEKDEQDQDHIIAAVNLWLKSRKNWLLILDNADDVPLASDFIHPTGGGHVILTTRAQNIGKFAHRINIEQMAPEEGVRLLLRRARTLERDIPLDSISKAERIFATKIAELLGGLPLALDQAGAYIQETACGLKGYLERYEKHRTELLELRGKVFMGHPEPVATTWSLSFERLQQTSPAAADLLRVSAFLHPDAIPEEIFLQGASELGPFLQIISSEVGLDALIGELRRHSLLDRYAESKTLRIHRLVQAVLRDGMSEETQHQWVERIIKALNSVFPDVESVNWQNCQRFILHAQAIHPAIEQWQIETEAAAHLLLKSGWYLCLQANYDVAEQYCQRAIAIFVKLFGENDSVLVNALDALAELYRVTGKFSQAEPLYIRAIMLCEGLSGTMDSKLATLLNNLALLYHEQGKYDLAEPLYLRSIAVNTEARGGIEHEYIAQSIANLGLLYYTQGKYAQAEPLYLQAIALSQKIQGANHPDVAHLVNNLAVLYKTQGKYAQAELLYRQSIEILEKTFGPEHPSIALGLNNLAKLYHAEEKYDLVEPLHLRAIAIRESRLQPQHPDIAQSLHNLALLYYVQGKYASAEPLYKRAIAIRKHAFGGEHALVALSLNKLADVYVREGNYAEAEQLYQQALAIFEKTSGMQHPDAAACLRSVGEFYCKQKQYDQAEPFLQQAIGVYEQSFGLDHPELAITLLLYAEILRKTGRLKEAEHCESRAKSIRENHVRSNVAMVNT